MTSFPRFSLAISLLLFSNSTTAAWQYTTWQMSPEDVKNAAPNAVYQLSDAEQTAKSDASSPVRALLRSAHKSGDLDFTAYFSFDTRTNHLSMVTLELIDTQMAQRTLSELTKKYGEPVEQKSGVFSSAVWHSGNDQIVYFNLNNERITISYFQRIEETLGNDGL